MSKENISRTHKLPSDFKEGDEVLYIPKNLLMGEKSKMVKESNLGVVTSLNDLYVFVRYMGNTGSQATNADDLFWINNRPDLQEILRNNTTNKQ